MENIIDILLYNGFIEVPSQTKHLGKTKGSLNSPEHVKHGEKNMLHNAKPARI